MKRVAVSFGLSDLRPFVPCLTLYNVEFVIVFNNRGRKGKRVPKIRNDPDNIRYRKLNGENRMARIKGGRSGGWLTGCVDILDAGSAVWEGY